MSSVRKSGRLVAGLSTALTVSLAGALSGCAATEPSATVTTPIRTTAPVEQAHSAGAAERVAVIGDSFSSGSDNSVVWPDLLAARYGVQMVNASESGAGYVAGDDFLGTFADQVDEVVASRPDLVLVVGSENDVDADPEDVGSRARTLYRTIATEAPTARVVVIGPIWSGSGIPDSMWDVDYAVRDAALDAGVDYVDALPLGWISDPAVIQDDGDHPTDAGQYELTDDIQRALEGVDEHLLG